MHTVRRNDQVGLKSPMVYNFNFAIDSVLLTLEIYNEAFDPPVALT